MGSTSNRNARTNRAVDAGGGARTMPLDATRATRPRTDRTTAAGGASKSNGCDLARPARRHSSRRHAIPPPPARDRRGEESGQHRQQPLAQHPAADERSAASRRRAERRITRGGSWTTSASVRCQAGFEPGRSPNIAVRHEQIRTDLAPQRNHHERWQRRISCGTPLSRTVVVSRCRPGYVWTSTPNEPSLPIAGMGFVLGVTRGSNSRPSVSASHP